MTSENTNTFRVVLVGIKDGISRADVQARLSKLFKTSPEQIDRLLAQLPYVIKDGLDKGRAIQYRTAIEAAGGCCDVLAFGAAGENSFRSAGGGALGSRGVDSRDEQGASARSSETVSDENVGSLGQRDEPRDVVSAEPLGSSDRTVAQAEGRVHFGRSRLAAAIFVLVGVALWGGAKLSGLHMAVETPSAAVVQAPTPDQYADLIEAARRFVESRASADLPCENIESMRLANIQRGTVGFITESGGTVNPPLPAIVAKIDAICIITSLRVTKPLDDWWMMLAHDKRYKTFRCGKIGGSDLVRKFADQGCEFLPNSGQSGLIDSKTSDEVKAASPLDQPKQVPPPGVSSVGGSHRYDVPTVLEGTIAKLRFL